MHRSNDTIPTIAAALAKAPMELTNPEKSLVGTIACISAGKLAIVRILTTGASLQFPGNRFIDQPTTCRENSRHTRLAS